MQKWSYCTLAVFFCFGFLFQGYFYEVPLLTFQILLYLVVLLQMVRCKDMNWHPVQWLLLLFCMLYGFVIPFAVDKEQAALEAFKVSVLLPVSFITLQLKPAYHAAIFKIWSWMGAVLVVIGLLFQLERKGRLESAFQYANTLAIFLLICILISILLYLSTARRSYLILLAIHGTGLFLTFSRSVWIIWLVMLVFLWVVYKKEMTLSRTKGILLAHIGSLFAAMLWKKDPLFFLSRVQSIQPKADEFQIRIVYWKDSFRMMRDYFWFGSGGGGWSTLQHIYQSRDYYVKYIHNQYIQILLDIGVWGLLLFLSMIVWFLFHNSKKFRQPGDIWNKAFLVLAVPFFIHAAFDFDLSFPVVFAMLVFIISASFAENAQKSVLLLPGKLGIGVVCSVMLVFLTLFGYGYAYKQAGMKLVQENRLEEAQLSFQEAKRAIPWASTFYYESAKAYVRLGNESGKKEDFYKAYTEIKMALQLVPQHYLYQSLWNDLSKNTNFE